MNADEFLNQVDKLRFTPRNWEKWVKDGYIAIWEEGDIDHPLAIDIRSSEDADFILWWYLHFRELVELMKRAKQANTTLQNSLTVLKEESQEQMDMFKAKYYPIAKFLKKTIEVIQSLQLENGCYDTACDLFTHSPRCISLTNIIKEYTVNGMEG